MGIVEKFIKLGQLTKEEYPELLHLYQDPDAIRLLREEAVRIQKKYFENKIYTRGLIEFTNYCRNDCTNDPGVGIIFFFRHLRFPFSLHFEKYF